MGEKKQRQSLPKDEDERVKVYLRLRPMDKLETSKRSKDCIELHENPKLITVDSPLLGTFDFTFHQIFDEYTPQLEVYKEVLSTIPRRLLNGVSCCVMAYGQTGSGKTHTMLGEGMGVELNVRALGLEEEDAYQQAGEKRVDPRRNPEVTEGMIPRLIADLFERLDDAPDSFEYTLRCSFVEIYLERVCDLLQPWREDVRIGLDERGEACITGAAELCCLDASDAYALLARGNAYRTKAATDQNMDSSRSHAVFTLRMERVNRENGTHMSTRLLMLDLAGSELGRQKSAKGKETASGMEGRMINASLSSLSNIMRGTLAEQGNTKIRYNPRAYNNAAKLAQLLRPCFGGTWFTTMICTGSPSSYNINETINTIRFGQQAREIINTPKAHPVLTTNTFQARLTESERKQEDLASLVKMLAHECKHVKGRSKGKDSGNAPLWNAIDKITSSTKHTDEKEIGVTIGKSNSTSNNNEIKEQTQAQIEELENLVEEHKLARDKAESGMRDMRSEITALRRQKECITKENLRSSRELHDSGEEIKNLSQRQLELENFLRTSQFREKEAILFLRQFRTFYFRLLKSKAAQGSGSTKDITNDVSKRIPGVSDLSSLLDVDKLMLESGLIEKSELGSDTSTVDYMASEEASKNSAQQASRTDQLELHLIDQMYGDEMEAHTGKRLSIMNSDGQTELSFGQLASYRQRLLETPGGRLAMKKEQELENDLVDMGKKVVILQNSLVAEKAMVEALSARQGAMGKMKAAQELNTLKQELERKTNDLHAIVWKMNELHLVNKTIDTKVESREQHVNYLEEHLVDLQTRNRSMVIDRQEMERRLREENDMLQDQVDGMAIQIWQLGDSQALPLWRMVVPYSGEQVELTILEEERERRFSLGNLEDLEIDGLVKIVEKS